MVEYLAKKRMIKPGFGFQETDKIVEGFSHINIYSKGINLAVLNDLYVRKFLLIVFVLWANITFGQYYDSAEGLKEAALKTALHNIIKGHTVRTYTDLWTDFQTTDKKANGYVWDMYSDVPGGTPAYDWTFVTDQCGNYSGEGSCYNREHSFPKSWFSDASPMYTELFHIYPTDGYVNGMRSNYPFGEVSSPTWTSTNGSKVGPNSTVGYSSTVFEPIDEYKGDFARTYFYMATRYEDILTGWSSDVLDGSTYNVYTAWHLDLLISWHDGDPVSQKETDRNEAVYGIQNNRNPFIDHPELVDYIWGTSFGSIWTTSAITTSPSDGATGVAINTTITYTYSDAIRHIDNSEITDANVDALIALKLTNSSGTDVGFDATIDVAKKIITVTPTTNLNNSQLYYSSVDAVEDASDNAFAFTEIDFTTIAVDNTAPTYTSVPADGATDVVAGTNITFTFDEAIRNLNDSEITDANVASLLILKETNASGANVAFTATIDANKEIITINPNADLSYDQLYYVAIASVEDASDNATTASSFSFTTVFSATVTPLPYTQPFATDLGDCSIYSVSGATKEWVWASAYASMNGYNTGVLEEDWLILPDIDFDNYSNEILTFDSWWRYGSDDVNNYLKLMYSTDYSGTGDPSGATWTELSYTQGASEVWTSSGTINLSSISGTSVYIAFKYHYNSGSYKWWGIDNISISEVADNTAPTLTTNPVDNATSVAITTDITLTFNEAIRKIDNSDIDNTNVDALITLKLDNASGTDVGFDATIDGDNKIITISPSTDLANDQVYYVAIASVEDASDNPTSVESITFTTTAAGSSGELFFSEYIEGSSNNKAIEIYNSTGSSVDLSAYSVSRYGNGSATATESITLSGTLLAGKVYVIYNSLAVQAIIDEGDLSNSSVTLFNGDDAMGLLKNSVLVDVIGEIGTDPGTAWAVAGTSGATANHTLIRKIGRTSGNTDWASSVGTTTVNSEWIVLAEDYFSNLGAYPDVTVWDGSVDTDWATAGNWSNGVPSSNYNASIPSGTVILGSAGSCNNLEIAAGGALTIGGGFTLTADGDVVIQSDATTSGSLIISGTLTSSAITYNRYMINNQWHMLGSPLTGQTLASFLTTGANSILLTGSDYSMKHYIEGPTEAWSTDYTSATAGDFALGQGYATKRSGSGVVSLLGTPNNATKSVTLTRDAYGWNLLSNPFTSAIAAKTGTANGDNNLLYANSSVMDPSYTALYIWDASSYIIINHAGGVQSYLQVGQGFFVRSSDPAAGTFATTPAMQSHQTSIAFKASEESIWASILLLAETNSDKSSTQIIYEENMSRGLDIGYDAGLFGSNSFSLYSRLIEDNGVDFALQCLPTDYEKLVVPIGLDAKVGDLVSFSAEALNIPEEYVVVLEDRESDVFTNLSEDGDKYTIQLTDDSDGIGRFFVHTVIQSALGLGDLEKENIFQVFTRPMNNQIVIHGEANSNTTARIYSITGKLIVTANLLQATENTIRFNEEAGIYIVQIVDKNGTFTQKIAWVK